MPAFLPNVYQQQTSAFQQTPQFFAPPMFNQPGQFEQVPAFPSFQQTDASVRNAAGAKNKRKKKKNNGGNSSLQGTLPPQVPYIQPQMPFIPASMPPHGGGMPVQAGPSVLEQQATTVQHGTDVVAVAKKPGKCWKCSVDSHATKDCKAVHYCLVCDTNAHLMAR
jgi:hypothetical protein